MEQTYKAFADNDYEYLKDSIAFGLFANSMGAMAQNTSERYLKHIIFEGYGPEGVQEELQKEHILRTLSLNKLLGFIEEHQIFHIEDREKDLISLANGYYFETQYPGENAIELTRYDLQKCMRSVETAKTVVEAFEHEREHSTRENSLTEDIDNRDTMDDDIR